MRGHALRRSDHRHATRAGGGRGRGESHRGVAMTATPLADCPISCTANDRCESMWCSTRGWLEAMAFVARTCQTRRLGSDIGDVT